MSIRRRTASALLARRVLRQRLAGRRIDPDDPARGRFESADIGWISGATLAEAARLRPEARIAELSSVGNRLNVSLAVLTVALYRALLDFGVARSHAADLVADIGWYVYELGARPVVLATRLTSSDPHRRMVVALRLLLRFPFSAPGRPGYEVEVVEQADRLLTTWTWCPPLAFVRRLAEVETDRGELEAFRRSWCSYDWAFNDRLVGGRGAYLRPHTMSEGADRCDMKWAVAPTDPQTTPVHLDPPDTRRPREESRSQAPPRTAGTG